jgi:hypothetical protein
MPENLICEEEEEEEEGTMHTRTLSLLYSLLFLIISRM